MKLLLLLLVIAGCSKKTDATILGINENLFSQVDLRMTDQFQWCLNNCMGRNEQVFKFKYAQYENGLSGYSECECTKNELELLKERLDKLEKKKSEAEVISDRLNKMKGL